MSTTTLNYKYNASSSLTSEAGSENLLLSKFSEVQKLNREPIRGCKKLLEIYYEVSHVSQECQPSSKVLGNLEKWSETKSLKIIISKITQVQ